MNTIGTKIFDIRKRKGLSQVELSDLSKINLRTLQRIEKGITEPHGNTLKNLCQVLDVKIEDILDYNKTHDLKFIKYFHLSVLTFMILPVGNVILPLILWRKKRDKIVYMEEQGINLLNFQILWTLICNGLLLLFTIFRVQHWSNGMFFLYLTGLLYLINILYPITISFLISKGRVRNYYYSGIKFIKN
jgi:transcriptional regulator with XRE-family HTH domain